MAHATSQEASAANAVPIVAQQTQAAVAPAPPSRAPSPGLALDMGVPGSWQFGGYGELVLQTAYYHPNPRVDDSSYRDSHLDLTRFALFVGTEMSRSISFSGEIEFEHGGTGVSREVEWDEFGEYETDVEKGGEVVLEQAYIEGRISDRFTLRGGHLLVPVGMTTLYHTPNLFSSTRRPEAEAQILPSIWHESGVELFMNYANWTARLQVVTGLDSTGFSSDRWIAQGTQRSFERPLINDPAIVLAIDFTKIIDLGAGGITFRDVILDPTKDAAVIETQQEIDKLIDALQGGVLPLFAR